MKTEESKLLGIIEDMLTCVTHANYPDGVASALMELRGEPSMPGVKFTKDSIVTARSA